MKVLRILLGVSLMTLLGCFKVVDKEKEKPEVEVESQSFLDEELLWEGEVFLNEDTEISAKRLVLRNATVYTQGFNLSIESAEILAQDSKIANFKEGQKAEPSTEGRSGSSIWIKAERASGDLYILMNGEHGGDGEQGQNNSNAGAKGKAGQFGYHKTALQGGRGIHPKVISICAKDPQDGAAGAKGPTGLPGKVGAPGGGSGALVFDVFEGDELRVLVERLAGNGGPGGAGGAGGPGGPGGDPGPLQVNKKMITGEDPFRLCRTAKPGPNGPQGDRGKTGMDGAPGEEQKICLRLKASENFNCY